MNLAEIIKYHTSEDEAQKVTSRYNEILEKLDSVIPAKPLIKSEEDYKKHRDIKHLLCSLACYTSNTKHPDSDKIWDLESAYGKEMERYNRRLLIKDSDAKTRARYLIWQKWFINMRHSELIKDVANDGNLAKVTNENGDISLFVIGLRYKIGDNTFRVDSKGREHRQYINTLGRQAIPVCLDANAIEKFTQCHADIAAKIPELDETYYVTRVGDRKGLIKNIAFRASEQNAIFNKYS